MGKLNEISGLIEYLDRKHFDPAHPENHNIRKVDGKFVAWDGEEWYPFYNDENLTTECMQYVNSDLENAVHDGINTAAPSVSSKLRQILDDWMLNGPGSAMMFKFPDVGKEGWPRGHYRRGMTSDADNIFTRYSRNHLVHTENATQCGISCSFFV
jgi:hypothetical protein